MNKNGILYSLTFPDGKLYIGATTQSLRERVERHKAAKHPSIKSVLVEAIRKFKKFEAKVLVVGEINFIKELETKAIATFQTLTPNGYNTGFGGNTSPMKNPFVAKKISRAMKLNNPMANPIHFKRMVKEIQTPQYREAQRIKALDQWADKNSKIRKAVEGENNPMKRPDVAAKSLRTRMENRK